MTSGVAVRATVRRPEKATQAATGQRPDGYGVERHDRALREADERDVAEVGAAVSREDLGQHGVEGRAGGLDPGGAGVGRDVAGAEPLAAHAGLVLGKGRVGLGEERAGDVLRERAREPVHVDAAWRAGRGAGSGAGASVV